MRLETDCETLRLFNSKVARLEATTFAARLEGDVPHVVMTMTDMRMEQTGPTSLDLVGCTWSKLENLTQDEIDAFVLTYRMFVQVNDRVSLQSLAKIYQREWMPDEATVAFGEAISQVEAFLESPTTVGFENGPMARRHLVDTVIYGALAHTDPRKEREFSSWTADGGLTGLVWAEFAAALQAMLGFLKYFRELDVAAIANCCP
jgi:hypothetical protein